LYSKPAKRLLDWQTTFSQKIVFTTFVQQRKEPGCPFTGFRQLISGLNQENLGSDYFKLRQPG